MGAPRRALSTARPRAGILLLSLVLLLAAFLMVALASCGGGGSSTSTSGGVTTTAGVTTSEGTGGSQQGSGGAGGGAKVVMKNLAFDPAEISVKVGESVTWTNEDSATHTVTGDNNEFSSGDLAQGASFSFTFDKAGTYSYHCSIHPNMKGTVQVQ